MDIPGLAGALETPEMMDKAQEQAEKLLEELKEKVQSKTKDIGTLRKEMTVTVPGEVIQHRLEHDYQELRHDAILPGFRKGRAPINLIQKRFGSDVRESLKTTIVGQSFLAAAEKEKIEALGDPLFRIEEESQVKLMDLGEALDKIKLPESGDFVYSCEVEIKPTFELPELKGMEIKAPKIEIDDAKIDESIERQRKIRGRYEPVSDAAAEADDMLVADVKLTSDGQLVKEEDNVQLGVRPTRLDGVSLMNLAEVLQGAKPDDTRHTDCTFPDDYERADLRGKPGRFEFKIHEIKRLAPAPLETLIEQYGVESADQLRQFVRDDMEAERDRLVELATKEQVLDHLLKSADLDLPEQLSARQTDRAVMRKVVELQQNGVPMSDVEARIDELRTSAKEEVARGLKLEFILEKVAEKLEVEVTDEEVNTEIARIARLYNHRFDRVRDDLQRRGLLQQLAEQIRQDKCVAILLRDAKVVEVTEEKKEKEKGKPAAKKKGGKKKAAEADEADAT